MYVLLFVVFAALFLFAALGFTIKFCFSLICHAQKRVVGIFSYSSPEDYHWITQGLDSPMFRDFVKSTFSSVISTRNKVKFREGVKKCDFAMLYHTKNRGRLNITNVTDSLYDEELRYMSMHKGRMNVIVVVDDLERADYEAKLRILQEQEDITRYARDLLLVSHGDKTHQRGINDKLQQIADLMDAESMHGLQYCSYQSSMARWVCRMVRHGGHQSSGEGLHAPLLV